MLAKVNGGGVERMLSFRVCMLFFNVFGVMLFGKYTSLVCYVVVLLLQHM